MKKLAGPAGDVSMNWLIALPWKKADDRMPVFHDVLMFGRISANGQEAQFFVNRTPALRCFRERLMENAPSCSALAEIETGC